MTTDIMKNLIYNEMRESMIGGEIFKSGRDYYLTKMAHRDFWVMPDEGFSDKAREMIKRIREETIQTCEEIFNKLNGKQV